MISVLLQVFKTASSDWAQRTEKMGLSGELKNPLTLRMVNDQIMKLERVWLLPQVDQLLSLKILSISYASMSQGLPGRPAIRHAVFGPSKSNSYGDLPSS